MATTIDHLRVDHRVTVLRDFTDAAGITMKAGQGGILRGLSFDQLRMEIHIEIEGPAGRIGLVFPLAGKTGPRNGHMRDYFEMGEDVSAPRPVPAELRPGEGAAPPRGRSSSAGDKTIDGSDRQEAAEKELLDTIPHIGAAASIAEMYARRMRAFRSAGDEPRAVAAFKLAVDWMGTYASWATSGGEGVAFSYERDKFHAALAREFGYDPTKIQS